MKFQSIEDLNRLILNRRKLNNECLKFTEKSEFFKFDAPLKIRVPYLNYN